MRDEAKKLVGEFGNPDSENYTLSLEECKQCALISINFTEQELAKHGVIRKEYYSDFRNEIQKL